MAQKRNQLRMYPVPRGAVLQEDYCLRVRPVGTQDWQELKTYRVKVDMHDVRCASMACFDFEGSVEVEITFPKFYTVYRVDIRPLSLGIRAQAQDRRIVFTLDRPANLSVEINKDRFHNLHLFAGAIEELPDKVGDNVLVAHGSLERPGFLGDGINGQLEAMPEGRTLYVEPGIYYIGECVWHLPSHTHIYLEPGAILIGGLALEHGEGLRIDGRGILYLADFARFSSINGIRLNHSRDYGNTFLLKRNTSGSPSNKSSINWKASNLERLSLTKILFSMVWYVICLPFAAQSKSVLITNQPFKSSGGFL